MIIIMLGAPGTGKGTVAGLLQEKTGIKQVATGLSLLSQRNKSFIKFI